MSNAEESVDTPACHIVELHSPVFTHVDCYHFTPQEKPLHQHPRKGCHEEEMKAGSDRETHHLQRREITRPSGAVVPCELPGACAQEEDSSLQIKQQNAQKCV